MAAGGRPHQTTAGHRTSLPSGRTAPQTAATPSPSLPRTLFSPVLPLCSRLPSPTGDGFTQSRIHPAYNLHAMTPSPSPETKLMPAPLYRRPATSDLSRYLCQGTVRRRDLCLDSSLPRSLYPSVYFAGTVAT